MNPLEYGKLIYQNINIFIIQINKTNVALIEKFDLYNHVNIFKEGDLMFEFKDHKLNDDTFVRNLGNRKFTFENNKLILIDSQKLILIFFLFCNNFNIIYNFIRK
jgi:hypothetical protein